MVGYMRFNTTGLKEMREFFDAVGDPPFKLIAQLEKQLAATFTATQAATHVITSSLKWSGKTSSDFDGKSWTGEISYGGPSTGVNNPVDYALYEMARGGAHNFLAPAEASEPAFEAIMLKYFPDEVK